MSEQKLVLGDCLDVFRNVRGLHAIGTDPPAGIGFMRRSWDKDRGGRAAWIAYWAERFAVARDACEDNAVGLFWALPRTQHWTATAVEDAGWKIRDVITHHFGQGWPKDKNALKPSTEMWILAVKGKPALGIDACRVERGVGAVPQFDRERGADLVGGYGPGMTSRTGESKDGSWPTNLVLSHFASDDGSFACQPCGTRKVRGSAPASGPTLTSASTSSARGRFNGTSATPPSYGGDDQTETVPAYLCAVGCDCGRSWLAESGGAAPRCECGLAGWWCCPVAEMDAESGRSESRKAPRGDGSKMGYGGGNGGQLSDGHADAGGASRYFPRFTYHAKAPSGERHAGCENLFWRVDKKDPFGFVRVTHEEWEALDLKLRAEGNVHPTVKRLSLMRWLHALTGAKRIGDLCGGSGSGMAAAYLDDIDWIGAEVCPQAIEIANARLAFWKGLSFEARERFLTDDVVPKAREAVDGQRRLF